MYIRYNIRIPCTNNLNFIQWILSRNECHYLILMISVHRFTAIQNPPLGIRPLYTLHIMYSESSASFSGSWRSYNNNGVVCLCVTRWMVVGDEFDKERGWGWSRPLGLRAWETDRVRGVADMEWPTNLQSGGSTWMEPSPSPELLPLWLTQWRFRI